MSKSDDSKKNNIEDAVADKSGKASGEKKDWEQVRHTATRTEIQTSHDSAAADLLAQVDKIDPALVVVQGDLIGKVFKLIEGRTIVGRHPTSNIVLGQRAVSTVHAEIRRNDGVVIIEDMGSTNGTMLNKTKLTKPQALTVGDLIRIGSSVFRYVEKQIDSSVSESMHQQMTRDALTGIFNRGYVMRALQSSIEIAKTGYPLGLIMFDLDHFKKVNDTYGHLAGDYVLKETCRVVSESVVRGEDAFGRYGGEEFIVIMPDCAADAAEQIAERVRSSIESHVFEFEGSKIPVTSSVGVASWVPKYDSADAFIAVVDELLYKSKQAGRNRVSSLRRS
jgi:two-component system cell cycle response regulator